MALATSSSGCAHPPAAPCKPSPSNIYRDRVGKTVEMTGVHHTILKCPERGPDIYVTEQVQTIYPASYQDQISIFDFSMRPSADGGSAFPRPDCSLQPQSRCPHGTNPGRTHRFYTGRAVVPFGTVSACISYWIVSPRQFWKGGHTRNQSILLGFALCHVPTCQHDCF